MSDLIDRQAAIDAMSTWDWQDLYLPIHFKQLLEELPSAQPQHKVRFSDADHVWIDGKQYISLKRFGEAVKDAQLRHYHEENLLTYAHDMGVTLEQAKKELTMITTAPEPHYDEWCDDCAEYDKENHSCPRFNRVIRETLDDVRKDAMAQRWIPVTERLPEDIRPVIVTWCNTDPASYYQHIVGKRFIGVAHYKSGKWYWYSSTTEDFLAEYGRYDGEEFDEAIEVIAWCEMPEPYKGEE